MPPATPEHPPAASAFGLLRARHALTPWLAALALLGAATPSLGEHVDLATLWDFSNPALSEQRFRQALATASGDTALILQTQIARTHGLRRNFGEARQLLMGIEEVVKTAGPEARSRWALEMARTYASAAHTPELLTPQAKAQARSHVEQSLAAAREGRLDALAIDAIHMMAFIDTAPADQLRWGREALAVSLVSDQPAATRWEASIRNNIGVALNQLGRHVEALAEFEQALALRRTAGNAQSIRVARWMVAHTLRLLQRPDAALAEQLALEREFEAAGRPDPYVFEELELLYAARGEAERAAQYAARRQALAR